MLEVIAGYIRPAAIDRAIGHARRKKWRTQRRLGLRSVLWLVIAIGLYGDLDQPGVWRQIFGTAACGQQALRGERPPAKSAFSQARAKLGPRPLRCLFVETTQSVPGAPAPASGLYRGRRVLIIDGQRLAIPDTPANAAAFGRPSTTRDGKHVEGGYPQVCTMRLIEAGTRMTLEAFIKPANHAEYRCAAPLLRRTRPGDLILWDACFYGHSLLKAAINSGRHVLGRVSSWPTLARVMTLSDGSFLTYVRPNRKGRNNPARAEMVRVIEYTLDDPARPGHKQTHRLVTTLLDPATDPALDLIVLYHERWEIEIANDELKTHLLARKVPLRSRTPRGVVQEFYGIMLAYNALRAIMNEAADAAGVEPRELSFLNSVRVVRETAPLMRAAETPKLRRIYDGMLAQIARHRLPPRDGRINPRVVKVKMSNFRKKNAADLKPVQPRGSFRDSVVMLS